MWNNDTSTFFVFIVIIIFHCFLFQTNLVNPTWTGWYYLAVVTPQQEAVGSKPVTMCRPSGLRADQAILAIQGNIFVHWKFLVLHLGHCWPSLSRHSYKVFECQFTFQHVRILNKYFLLLWCIKIMSLFCTAITVRPATKAVTIPPHPVTTSLRRRPLQPGLITNAATFKLLFPLVTLHQSAVDLV